MSIKCADKRSSEVRLKGLPLSEGIAIGRPFLLLSDERSPLQFSIPQDEIEQEIERYRNALKDSCEEMQLLKQRLERDNRIESVEIIESQIQMLYDPSITVEIEDRIRNSLLNIESVFDTTLQEYQQMFSKIADDYFRKKFADIKDIAHRVMHHLGSQKRFSIQGMPNDAIVFAHELVPSDAAETRLRNIRGFVTEIGGEASHVAIMARAEGVPCVANIGFTHADLEDVELVIIDGFTGEVIYNPSKEVLEQFQLKKQRFEDSFRKFELAKELGNETIDGYQVRLSANLEVDSECDMLHEYGSSGVGLFRTESLFLAQRSFPDEQQQYLAYKRMIENIKGLPVVIRTFDVGGDKEGDTYHWKNENNPYLGCRAIRFMFKEREIFKEQLRAILRASAHGDVSMLFPMVSGLAELRAAKELVEEVKEELRKAGKPYNPSIRIGCMIEVPSAALTCDMLARECDFLSVGTNDLVQYSLAVDRGNQAVSYLYHPTHPSVIRLIKMIVSEANRHGIPVTMCGEMAADPKATALLLGLGIQEFSVTSRSLPIIKNIIRQTYIVEAAQLAEKVLSMTTPEEIHDFLLSHTPEMRY